MAGSLRQRGKTSWQLRVLAGRDEITGKKSYVSKTFRGGRREAERELARLVAEVEAGSTTAAAGTVAELCNKWFEYACPNLSPAVSAEYRRLLDRRILPRWGSTPVRRLRTSELDGWYSQLRRSGSATGGPLSPNSVVRVHAILRRALNQGVRWGWITTNPAVAATPPRVLRRQLDIPSPADIARLIKAAELVNPALPAFIRLAAASGARRGELCALRWRNIDLEARSLHVAGAIVQINKTVIEKDTKTHAERRVALDEGTVRVLQALRDRMVLALAIAEEELPSDAFVFSHRPDGLAPWYPNYATLSFARLAEREGMGHVRLHDLRHFAATTMLVNGVDVRTTAGRLGHAQSSTTLNVYAHFVKAADAGAARAIGSALDGFPNEVVAERRR
ncbi:MAG: tyrosine-type recombinase/integrase [Ilumatobacteraceae bacterium]